MQHCFLLSWKSLRSQKSLRFWCAKRCLLHDKRVWRTAKNQKNCCPLNAAPWSTLWSSLVLVLFVHCHCRCQVAKCLRMQMSQQQWTLQPTKRTSQHSCIASQLLGISKPMVCMGVAFHEIDEDNSDSHKQGVVCWLSWHHRNYGNEETTGIRGASQGLSKRRA